jgi:hypothetical protein
MLISGWHMNLVQSTSCAILSLILEVCVDLKNLLVLCVWFLQAYESHIFTQHKILESACVSNYFHGLSVDNPYRDYGEKYLKPIAVQKI